MLYIPFKRNVRSHETYSIYFLSQMQAIAQMSLIIGIIYELIHSTGG